MKQTAAAIVLNMMVVGCLFAFAFWTALPFFCQDVDGLLKAQTPARIYYDREGAELLLEPTYDYQMRLDVPLKSISAHACQVILAIEDRHFLEHDGVDRIAALRSLWMNLRHGGVMSGASTITMQLAGMTLPRRRTLKRKLLQAGCARKLEWLHGKEWILENYLNRIPFGGKIHGMEAASRYYFGHGAARLNRAEATLLCGLPQRPNAFRPDRHPENARGRQRMVLWMMETAGVLNRKEVLEAYDPRKLAYRNFREPSPLKNFSLCRTDHYLTLARAEAEGAQVVYCALDQQLQRLLTETLRRQTAELPGVHDAAGVVMDNATGQVLAMVGTLDFNSRRAGQVNVAMRRRTAGSALKPFIYAEAIDGGMLTADTLVYDTPLRYGTYTPGNYDGTYMRGVSAQEALSRSLNTPVVRLVARLGAARVLDMFRKLGLLHWNTWQDNASLARKLGLTLALGTGGYRLLNLTAAYVTLAGGGLYAKPSFLNGPQEKCGQVFSRGTCAVVTSMLRTRPLPGCLFDHAWKTGTSTGNHDAWCFAYTSEITVGVWFGNKDGRPSAALVGASAAAPAAAAVLNAVYRDRLPGPFNLEPDMAEVELCPLTGLRANPGCCRGEKKGVVPKGIPLVQCTQCRGRQTQAVTILKPLPSRYVASRNGTVSLELQTNPPATHWYVNDSYKGQFGPNGRIVLTPGTYTLRAVSEQEGMHSATVKVTVLPGRKR